MYNKQLETFIQVVESGSFAKAAEALYITPTAVIKQINLLESGLGLQLFIRTHRGVVLTDSGKSLLADAKYIIAYSKASLERARAALETHTNTIRIGTSLMTPSRFLVELWPQIQSMCPNLKIQLVSFENTPENAREILMHLGQNIDVVAGVFDSLMLKERKCNALELSRKPLCCAVSVNHRLATKEKLTTRDLYGENLLLIRSGWNYQVDALRNDIRQNHPQITIEEFLFYNVSVFNKCENSNDVLMAFDIWEEVHPLLKIIPVDWPYETPFGLLYSPTPSEHVRLFVNALSKVFVQNA